MKTWDKTICSTLHFFAIFDIQIQTKLLRSLSKVVLFMFFHFCSCRVLSKTEENTEKYFFICKEQKICRTLQKKPWNFVMQSSPHLEIVEKKLRFDEMYKLKKLILIFDESGARYMALVTCDLINFEFNFWKKCWVWV
jgi:hypothetical protein